MSHRASDQKTSDESGTLTAAPFYRPTWVEISTRAFASNVRQVKLVAGVGCKLIAVLKADAYGHGAVALAPVAVENGASMIGVSSLEEGIALRESGVSAPILLLGSIFPLDNFKVALRHDLTPTVSSLDAARELADIAAKGGCMAPFHLKIDTGMGRIGVSPIGAKAILEWLRGQKSVRLAGLYSHFAAADSNPAMVQDQLRQFQTVRDLALSLGFNDVVFHLANSAATLRYPETRFDMVRPGLSLYGVANVPLPDDVKLHPVLSWHTRIAFLKKMPAGATISYGATFRTARESSIATLPVGYADGVPRHASNKGFVLIKGRRCPIVGRVTMDHIMVDVTGIPADIGDAVTLIGRQGDEELTVHDWAHWADTISYEILCGITKRVPRVGAP